MVLDTLGLRFKMTDRSPEMVQLVSHSPGPFHVNLKMWKGRGDFVCLLQMRKTGVLNQSFAASAGSGSWFVWLWPCPLFC